MNPTNAPSYRQDNTNTPDGPVGAPKSYCAATLFTVQCIAMFCHQQLYTASFQEEYIFKGMPPISLLNLIAEGLAEDYIKNETRTALGFSSGFLAKEYSIPAMLLCQYQNH